MTGIFTYPSYFEFDKILGPEGDPDMFLNAFWWYNHNIIHPNSTDLHWLFYTDYQFYPLGAPLNDIGNIDSILSIPLALMIGNFVQVYNILMYSALILTGYGTFLLARHLTQNYSASIIAAVIFTYSIYHTWHALAHLGLVTTQFIPLCVLFLLKTIESTKMRNPVIAGIFLFLVMISSFYLGFYMILFLIIFIAYLIIKKEKPKVFLRFGIMILFAIVLSSPFYYEHYLANSTNSLIEGRSLVGFNAFSADLTNFFIPSSTQTITKIVNYPWGTDKGGGETSTFLGYTAIFLVGVSILKSDRNQKLFWIISSIIFGILSMGPFLKIFGTNTHFPLPYYFLYQIPVFDLFRATGRAALFVTFSVSMLAAYGTIEIFKLRFMTGNRKVLITVIIVSLVVFESITIPFPNDKLVVPDIYYAIANDPQRSVVLESPIGGINTSIEDVGYGSMIKYQFFQTVHQKPIYSGFEAGVSEKTQRYIQTYFLNSFLWHQTTNDVVKQDMKKVGISLLNYFNIGYVIVHKNFYYIYQDNITKTWIPQTSTMLNKIFSKQPDYEDDQLFAYKVPKSDSLDPFIVLGNGWDPLLNDYRTFGNNATIKILNPRNESINANLEIKFDTSSNTEVILFFEGIKISETNSDANTFYDISTRLIKLNPGENNIVICETNKKPNIDVVCTGNHDVAIKSISLNSYQ